MNFASFLLAASLVVLVLVKLGKHFRPPESDEQRVLYRVLEVSMWGMFGICLPLTLFVLWRG